MPWWDHIQGARYQMKKSHIAVILVFMSTGCASVRVGDLGHQRVVLPVNPTAPNISIATDSNNKDSILIDQEPIVLSKASSVAVEGSNPLIKVTTIQWALPVLSQYEFDASQGIVIIPYEAGPAPVPVRGGPLCTPGKKVYTCSYVTPDSGTKYKYSVLVRDSKTQTPLDRLDPTVWN